VVGQMQKKHPELVSHHTPFKTDSLSQTHTRAQPSPTCDLFHQLLKALTITRTPSNPPIFRCYLLHSIQYPDNRYTYRPHSIQYPDNRYTYRPHSIQYPDNRYTYRPHSIQYPDNRYTYRPHSIQYPDNRYTYRLHSIQIPITVTLPDILEGDLQSAGGVAGEARSLGRGTAHV
jgi:hypothetical protein